MHSTFIVNCAVYPFDILVHIGKDKKNLFKFLKGRIAKDEFRHIKKFRFSRGNSIFLKNGQTILTIDKLSYNPVDISTLAHEVYHCTSFILKRVGLKQGRHTEEAYAYLIEYITKSIIQAATSSFS